MKKTGMFLTAALVALMVAAFLAPASVAGDPPPDGAGAADPLFMFKGQGRAHGVGMCMDGVYYIASHGWKYHDILNFYYTGIQFGRTDENRPVRVKGRDGQIRTWPMKQYLYHLQEEPESCPMEELKVLYVAARTYTLSCINRNKHTSQGFDICSSGECCQAFDENKDLSKFPKNCEAVDVTAGEIITHGGQPIIAAYCGSCGGHTEDNEDVWGGEAIPYLRGKADPYCQYSSRFAWQVAMRKSEVEARLNAYADSAVGSLYSMDLSLRTPGGRVKTARLSGSNGTFSISGGALSTRLGLQSQMFWLMSSNFDEYILLLNPNDAATVAAFTFMRPDGETTQQLVEVPAHSRYTLKVNDYAQFQEVSTKVVSDLPVIAERAIYFNYHGDMGGSASAGVTRTSTSWYFAEGYTGGRFDTYVLVENPEEQQADVRFKFMLPGGKTRELTAKVPATSRFTLHLDEVPGLADTDVSTKVESLNGVGVVADRSMYFDYSGLNGGSSEAGVEAPAKQWYLAEGYTGGRFDTYVLVQNPSSKAADIEVTFMRERGGNIVKRYSLKPHSRYTIKADAIKGLEDAEFSTRVESKSDADVIAERAMYFDYNGLAGGHSGKGVTAPAADWFFAEGYTGGAFDTYILIQNPGAKTAEVLATFTRPNGTSVAKEYEIRPFSRFTVPVDRVKGLSDAEVSTAIHSTNGVKVIAERAMYFNYQSGIDSRGGGHDTAGVQAPSEVWYFAEGYTGY